jgi:polyphosphate kinase
MVEPLNAREATIVALGTPSGREMTQWYFQRYIPHLPAAGEIVLFDRSWYNRAGVERAMGFCTDEQYWEFMHTCPELERMLVRDGIILHSEATWYTVESDDKRRARLNCISHILDTIDYEDVLPGPIELPARPERGD